MRILCILFAATIASGAEVTRVGRWEFHNSFWMNLHQTLMSDAAARAPRDVSKLPKEQQDTWNAAVAVYREAWGGKGSITFSRVMMEAQDALGQVADDAIRPSLSGTIGEALLHAAPVYRAGAWREDWLANDFYIGYASAMVRHAGDEIAAGHEAIYRGKLATTIRVDVAAHAGVFGAYTHTLPNTGPVLTISSRDPGNQGHAALELVLHESSHTFVHPDYGTLGDAIRDASKRAGIEPPRDLWHAILFSTTSELTRQALLKRGVADYKPFSADLLTRAWPHYRAAIETHWLPYMNGKGTLEGAVEKIVSNVRRE